MNLWFRTLLVLIKAFWRPKLDILAKGTVHLRVMPTDLDIAIHMNNGRYLSIADVGRFDLIIRTGLWAALRKHGWHPVVGSAKVMYRRSLEPFQAFDLTSQVIGWDEKWIYLEHTFMRGETMCARIVIKTLFLKGRDKVPNTAILHELGHDEPSPSIDADILAALA